MHVRHSINDPVAQHLWRTDEIKVEEKLGIKQGVKERFYL